MKQKQILHILVADDQEVDIEGLCKMISDAGDMEVIESTQDISTVYGLVEQLKPDVVVIDIDWYGDHNAGIRVIERLKQLHVELAIVAVTVYPELVGEANHAGVLSLKKNFTRRELWAAIRQAYQFRDSKRPIKQLAPGFTELTSREKEVLACISRGRSDDQIALELKISSGTVKKHVGNILHKLNVSSRTEAAVLAERHGFTR
jgi:DNA-binding NarL/FixJ family response regulator